MNKLKDLGLLVLQVEVVGFLFIAMNKYLTNTTSFLPEAFTQDKTDIKAYSLAAFAFMILGIAQYYVVDLYDKINWKKASVIEYLVEVAGVLLVFIYLQFIDNLVKFAFLFVLVSFLFIMRYLYFYKKFA
jgi:uncharacterized membrane protein YoaK (UPF0700 family)